MPTTDLNTAFNVVLEIPFNVQNLEELRELSNSLVAINSFYAAMSETHNDFPIQPDLISLDIHSFPKLKLKVNATWLAIFISFTASYDKIPGNLGEMKDDAKTAVQEI